jgi:hypothetical protein
MNRLLSLLVTVAFAIAGVSGVVADVRGGDQTDQPGADTRDGKDDHKGRLKAPHCPGPLRWTLVLNTGDGKEYARQLGVLGAIIAVPEGQGGDFRFYRDLTKRPVKGEVEDVAKIKGIYWVDDKADSVKGLCHVLGIEPVPEYFVAFFPAALEENFARLQREYLKEKHPGKTVADVISTRFEFRDNEIRVAEIEVKGQP